MEPHDTATECHLPRGITQCYLPPDTSEHTPPDRPVRVLDLPTPEDGRLSWPRWLVTNRDGLPARRRWPIQVLTGPSVD